MTPSWQPAAPSGLWLEVAALRGVGSGGVMAVGPSPWRCIALRRVVGHLHASCPLPPGGPHRRRLRASQVVGFGAACSVLKWSATVEEGGGLASGSPDLVRPSPRGAVRCNVHGRGVRRAACGAAHRATAAGQACEGGVRVWSVGGAMAADKAAREFVDAVAAAVEREDAVALGRLFDVVAPKWPGAAAVVAAPARVDWVADADTTGMGAWATVAAHHLASLAAAGRPGAEEAAFTACHAALSAFVIHLLQEATNWVVPTLHALARNAVTLVRRWEAASTATGAREAPAEKRNTLVGTLRNAFNYTLNHRTPRDQMAISRKWGAVYIANLLLGIYFRTDQLRQCNSLIAGIRSPAFPPLDAFPPSQVTTFLYYSGMLAMYEDKLAQAHDLLSEALSRCHAGHHANRRKIVRAWIPVGMVASGRVPTPTLLARYGLTEVYAPMVEAVASGNVATYAAAMATHMDWYIQAGVYMVMERLQMLVYRTLVKKTCAIIGELSGTEKVKLSYLVAAWSAAGSACDVEEVECILANLIHRKWIRGYLSHKPPFLVCAKTNAFPPMPEVLGGGGTGVVGGAGGKR